MAAFDDYGPLTAIPLPTAMPATVATELCACSAKFSAFTKVTAFTKFTAITVTIAADANADADVLRTGYGRCCNRNGRKRCKRKTKFLHAVLSLVTAQYKNGGTGS
jgi:hypothetical protein